jgi:hypothetical protein
LIVGENTNNGVRFMNDYMKGYAGAGKFVLAPQTIEN